jgi:hypothetical protein
MSESVAPPDVWFICPCCKQRCDDLHEWAYCGACWYTVVGGDLASDEALMEGVTVSLRASTL